jgi:hypothetical protein
MGLTVDQVLRLRGFESLTHHSTEDKRMVSGDTGNVVPRKGLWVRSPCPPLNARADLS